MILLLNSSTVLTPQSSSKLILNAYITLTIDTAGFFGKKLLIYLKGSTKKVREGEIFIHSLISSNDQGWSRPKAGPGNSIQISYMGGCELKWLSHHLLPPGYTGMKLEKKKRQYSTAGISVCDVAIASGSLTHYTTTLITIEPYYQYFF